MSVTQLPPSTVKLIASTQVITTVSSVIKELMENSIDSGASHIEIKLDKNGFEKIEIKDDGCGIRKSDVTLTCLSSYTSKISDFSDLDNLSSYGFRGEALSALCNVAQVSITTKTDEDQIASTYTYDKNGQVICSKMSHITKGTIVTVTDLFKNLPVRKQYMSNSKKASEELRKVDKIVKCLAMIHPRLRVALVHNKFLIWQKSSVANLRQSVMQVIPLSIVKQLHHHITNTEQIRVEFLIPKRDCDISSICFSNFSEASFLFINNRPVRHKEVEKTLYGKLFEYFGVYLPVNKNPVSIMCITVPADCLDVNLEPNKTRVYFKNQDDVLEIINQCLHLYYGDQRKENEENKTSPLKQNKKRKMDDKEGLEIVPKKIELDYATETRTTEEHSERVPTIIGSESNADSGNTLESQENNEGFENSEESIEFVSCKLTQENLVDAKFEKYCLERAKDFKEDELNSNPRLLSNQDVSEDILNKKLINNDDFILRMDDGNQSHSEPQLEYSDSSDILNTTFSCSSEGTDHLVNKLTLDEPDLMVKKVSPKDKDLMVNKLQDNTINETANSQFSQDTELDNCQNFSRNETLMQEKNKNYTNTNTNKIEESNDDPNPYKRVQESLGFSPPTLSQWSRGDVNSSSGVKSKGPGVLTTGSPALESPSSLSNRSVSSQMGCKEMSAFTKFARTMRKQILEEHPNTCFTKVAQQLQDKWRNLNESEKKKYEETQIVKKPAVSNGKQATLDATFTTLNKEANIEIDVKMEHLQSAVKSSKAGDIGQVGQTHLIGQLEASDLWLFTDRQSNLTVISSSRLVEAVKFHKHLESFSVPKKLLEQHIPVLPSELGEAAWRRLLALSRSPNGIVTDPRITHNGFYVDISEDEQQASITHVAQNISYYGTEELGEVLNLMERHGPNATLTQCRPLKVICFLRSEVMRDCLQNKQLLESAQVRDLLHYWLESVSVDTPDCIHHLPVTHMLDTT